MTETKSNHQLKDSTSTYETLKSELGKEFVDKALFRIIGFDNTLDIASHDSEAGEYSENVSQELQNLLSDKNSTIKLAKEKVNKEIMKRYDLYFHALKKDGTTIENIKTRIIEMINDIAGRVNSASIEDLYYDFALLFTFSTHLKFDHKSHFGEYIDDPKRDMHLHLKETEFKKVFLTYLQSFFQRIDNATAEEQKKIYFISELLRRQSGEREWIGNSMNPMIQFMTLDDMFGKGGNYHIKWAVPKLIFKIKKNIPGTDQNARKRIGKELEKIIKEHLFPKKYHK